MKFSILNCPCSIKEGREADKFNFYSNKKEQ